MADAVRGRPRVSFFIVILHLTRQVCQTRTSKHRYPVRLNRSPDRPGHPSSWASRTGSGRLAPNDSARSKRGGACGLRLAKPAPPPLCLGAELKGTLKVQVSPYAFCIWRGKFAKGEHRGIGYAIRLHRPSHGVRTRIRRWSVHCPSNRVNPRLPISQLLRGRTKVIQQVGLGI
jgi:hypothetical protein